MPRGELAFPPRVSLHKAARPDSGWPGAGIGEVRVTRPDRDELLAIRDGALSYDALVDRCRAGKDKGPVDTLDDQQRGGLWEWVQAHSSWLAEHFPIEEPHVVRDGEVDAADAGQEAA